MTHLMICDDIHRNAARVGDQTQGGKACLFRGGSIRLMYGADMSICSASSAWVNLFTNPPDGIR